jgi:hypothetical protein
MEASAETGRAIAEAFSCTEKGAEAGTGGLGGDWAGRGVAEGVQGTAARGAGRRPRALGEKKRSSFHAEALTSMWRGTPPHRSKTQCM